MKKITTIAALSVALGAGFATAPAAFASIAPAPAPLGGVDMQRACDTQYPPASRLRAEVLNQHDAFSWRCAAPQNRGPVYGINVNRECVVQYGRGAFAGLRNIHNPYSWFCRR